jgi:integrase
LFIIDLIHFSTGSRLPEPTKSIITLIVVGSLRIGEVAPLRWERIHPDRIEVVERFYEGEFNDTKPTPDAGAFRVIPLGFCEVFWNRLGCGPSAEIQVIWYSQRTRRTDKPTESTAKAAQADDKKACPASPVDFRSFRTMHSSLMSSIGVRPEVTRDNMGHATIDVTQNVYNKTWGEERVEAVSLAAATVWREFMPTQKALAPM